MSASRAQRVSRGLRRIRARWRLHRMEWNGMHAPLEPPPGYESYAKKESVLPGLDGVQPIQSPAHFLRVLRHAWKLYRHHYVPDPDLAKEEEAREAVRRVAARKDERRLRREQRQVVKQATEAAKEMHSKLPDSTDVLQQRLDILNLSLKEFSDGFAEAASGATTLFGSKPYNEDNVKLGNRPVVYKVDAD